LVAAAAEAARLTAVGGTVEINVCCAIAAVVARIPWHHWRVALRVSALYLFEKGLAMSHSQPNHFDLKGADGTQIRCSISASNEYTVTVNGKLHADAEVQTDNVAVGTLVTVTTLISDRAGRRRLFSLLLPRFSEGGEHEFATVGIFTADAEHAVAPPHGAITSYQAIELKGTARRVRAAHA
jgi:hypothetical protein